MIVPERVAVFIYSVSNKARLRAILLVHATDRQATQSENISSKMKSFKLQQTLMHALNCSSNLFHDKQMN